MNPSKEARETNFWEVAEPIMKDCSELMRIHFGYPKEMMHGMLSWREKRMVNSAMFFILKICRELTEG